MTENVRFICSINNVHAWIKGRGDTSQKTGRVCKVDYECVSISCLGYSDLSREGVNQNSGNAARIPGRVNM